MRFKFCSDGDCPLWVLAALNALGSLPAQLFRTLLLHVTEEQSDDGVMTILKNTSLSSRDECARAVAAIRWVMQQTMRCACSSTQLTRDLLVMGFPRAHAAAFAEAANNARETHVAQAQATGFMINKLTHATITDGPEGTLDAYKLVLSSETTFTGEQKLSELLIEDATADTLLAELKKAYQKMEQLEDNELV